MSLSRRAFVSMVTALATPRWAHAQRARPGVSVGWLGTTDLSFKEPYSLAFVQRLGELGS